MKNITITELRKIFDCIISRLDLEDEKSYNFDTDLYNIIPTHRWNNLSNKEPVIGSLFDDIDELKRVLDEEDRVCNYVDFDRLASVLRQISQIQNPI